MDRCCREMTFEEEAVFYEKEARKILERQSKDCDDSEISAIARRGMRVIRKAKDELQCAKNAQKWIPVTEPPKEWRDENCIMVNYLIHVPEYGVEIGHYMKPAKCWFCMGIPCKATHWMPLPEAPKEDA